WDDGQELPDMSAQQYLPFASSDEGTRILALGSRSDFPDIGNDKWQHVAVAEPGELPDNWLAYTNLDVVVMNPTQLSEVVEKHPRRFAALRAWVTTGGNLWVYNVPASDQRRAELSALLDALPTDVDSDTVAPAERWRDPDPSVSVNRGKFVWRPLGCGVVVAFEAKRTRSGNLNWTSVCDCAGQGRTDWQSRHGVSFAGSNNDFWTLTIPGVGLPPIKTFYILITVFVVAIGPVNYVLLRRRHRLNLMAVTVPVSAALVSGGLLIYALIADGLDTRMRTRSLTQIDQRRGEAVCWSRLSYYAGRARSAGLKFATDTAIYPLDAEVSRSAGTRPTREISWTDDQHLGRGWLLARTATQLVTVRHRVSDMRLDIEQRDEASPRAVNRLGCHLKRLWLVDGDGQWYEWSGGEVDGKLDFVVTDFLQFKDNWQKVHHAAALRYPDDVHSGWTTGSFFSGFKPPGVDSAESILERSMVQPLDENSRRSYVAVTDGSAELQRGLEPDSETPDFHVIVGRW
ncbi:MAG TPA: hypothetical protein VHV77_05085, partial [Pirellulales bacterium]|nr:hypothetical protein [Pirellulales bacterium]